MTRAATTLRFGDYAVTPWKNGLGVTREIARGGARPGERFDWRLSMAEIAVDAPFSVYPGIERHLAVVAGGPLELVIAGVPRRIEIGGEITTFTGDAAVSARPLGGAVTDLNLMIDPSRCSGSLELVPIGGSTEAVSIVVVVSIRDGLLVRAIEPDGSIVDHELNALDCLFPNGAVRLTLEGAAPSPMLDPVAVLVRVSEPEPER